MIDVDLLANEIRRVDGSHSLGAGALAEALMPFIAAHLSQPKPVAQGEFSVQVTSERMEEVITSMQGPDGEACAGTLWVGRLDDCGPDGSSRYGIHISCNECPEEGSVTLAEFDAPKVVAQGEAVETDQSIQADCYEMIAEKYEAVGMSPASIVETSEYLADAWTAFQDLPDDTIDRLLVGKATEGDQALVHGAISTIRDLQGEAGFKATPTLPAGHRVVPVEPTEAMALAAAKSVSGEWVDDPDSIPKPIIDACRNAICAEFGNKGTDGYYKRIIAKVVSAILAAAPDAGGV